MNIPADDVARDNAPLFPEPGCQLKSFPSIFFHIEQKNSGSCRSLHTGRLFNALKKIEHIEGESRGRNRTSVTSHELVIPATSADRLSDRGNKSFKSDTGVIGKTSYLTEVDGEFIPYPMNCEYLYNFGKVVQRTSGTIVSYSCRGFLNYVRAAEHSRECGYFGFYRVRDTFTFEYRSYGGGILPCNSLLQGIFHGLC